MRLLPIRADHGDAGFVETNSVPTDADTDANMSNICRCGTYDRIRKAIHLAADLMQESGS